MSWTRASIEQTREDVAVARIIIRKFIVLGRVSSTITSNRGCRAENRARKSRAEEPPKREKIKCGSLVLREDAMSTSSLANINNASVEKERARATECIGLVIR